ncbi:DNA cytosine methyltransferase, partial [Planktothrix agardhii]
MGYPNSRVINLTKKSLSRLLIINQGEQNLSQFKKRTAVELFAGIGGFRLGLEASQIQTIWANDINELCGQVYESNF